MQIYTNRIKPYGLSWKREKNDKFQTSHKKNHSSFVIRLILVTTKKTLLFQLDKPQIQSFASKMCCCGNGEKWCVWCWQFKISKWLYLPAIRSIDINKVSAITIKMENQPIFDHNEMTRKIFMTFYQFVWSASITHKPKYKFEAKKKSARLNFQYWPLLNIIPFGAQYR